jgi:hypothetical protein
VTCDRLPGTPPPDPRWPPATAGPWCRGSIQRHVGVRADRRRVRRHPRHGFLARRPDVRRGHLQRRPASGYSCPGAPGSSGDGLPPRPTAQVSGQGGVGSFGPLVQTMDQARHTAVGRMATECAELGGHGMVGVRLSQGSFSLAGRSAPSSAPRSARKVPRTGHRCPSAVSCPGRISEADHHGLDACEACARHLDRVAAR